MNNRIYYKIYWGAFILFRHLLLILKFDGGVDSNAYLFRQSSGQNDWSTGL